MRPHAPVKRPRDRRASAQAALSTSRGCRHPVRLPLALPFPQNFFMHAHRKDTDYLRDLFRDISHRSATGVPP
jgi:hypothetical protein